jgi:hypothetical protein
MPNDAEQPAKPTASLGLETLLQSKLTQAAAGLILLAVAGAAGGQIAGFRVEPTECAECRENLAACAARDELIIQALEKAEVALRECHND